MKLVKFNASTMVHMIPDDKYQELCDKMEKLYDEDYEEYIKRYNTPSKFRTKFIKAGETTEVPDWFYEANKNREVAVPIHLPKYRYTDGSPKPFKVYEARIHYEDKFLEKNSLITTVKLFELISDVAKSVDNPIRRKSNTTIGV